MDPGSAERAVDALVDARFLDASARDEAVALLAGVLGAVPGADALPRRRLQLVEVVAYLGGGLVLAAGALFLFQEWSGLGFGLRVFLLSLVTTVLLVAGVVAARVPSDGPDLGDRLNEARRRLAGTLLTFAALGAAFLVGLVVDRFLTSTVAGIYWPVVLGALAGVVVGASGYRVAPCAVGLVGTIAGAVIATTGVVVGVDRFEAEASGVALVLVGLVWLVLVERGWFRETTVARALGLAVALMGAQVPVLDGAHAWLGYALTLAVAVGGIAGYLATAAWPWLAAAVLALTLVVPEAVGDWTGGSLGAVGGVLVTGITLLAASFAGYRLRAEATD